ncbi:MAG: RluA family pseudouridine synthase, partial [Kiritimatiellae bacterium]|nr:RluA family pseudouridine synthase [Kiritimatiellia bacterium]
VHGRPARMEGTITSTIGRHPVDRKRMAANPPRGKAAVTHYRIEEALGSVTLLRLRIETGRTHQIRVHLAHIGHPVVGDQLYGDHTRDRRLPGCPARQMLHAAVLELDHPGDGRRMTFMRAPPPDMSDFLASLR